MKLIAHRGDRTNFPENTTVAIQSAIDSELHGVEFDLELTKDLEIVVLHQETLENETNKLKPATLSLTREWINNLNFDEVKNIDAGSWHDQNFGAVKIPAINEILALDWKSKECFIEIKDPFYWKKRNLTYEENILKKLVPLIKRNPEIKTTICSYNHEILIKLRKSFPDMKLGLNIWYDHGATVKQAEQCNNLIGLDYIAFHDQYLLDKTEVINTVKSWYVHLATFPFSKYQADGHLNIENSHLANINKLLKAGVDYFFIDDVSIIKDIRSE